MVVIWYVTPCGLAHVDNTALVHVTPCSLAHVNNTALVPTNRLLRPRISQKGLSTLSKTVQGQKFDGDMLTGWGLNLKRITDTVRTAQ